MVLDVVQIAPRRHAVDGHVHVIFPRGQNLVELKPDLQPLSGIEIGQPDVLVERRRPEASLMLVAHQETHRKIGDTLTGPDDDSQGDGLTRTEPIARLAVWGNETDLYGLGGSPLAVRLDPTGHRKLPSSARVILVAQELHLFADQF